MVSTLGGDFLPKQTFFNLDIKRQREIIDIALKEFSCHNFETASMNKIINALGVAKGSFYRYFTSKKDLYFYILDYGLNQKIDYLEKNINTSEGDFFNIYKNTVLNYFKFDLIHPILSKFLKLAVENKYIEPTKVLNSLHGKTFISNLIVQGQKDGSVKNFLDVDFVILCIINLSETMLSYINTKLGVSYKEILNITEGKCSYYKDDLEQVFSQFMEVLTTGLKPTIINN